MLSASLAALTIVPGQQLLAQLTYQPQQQTPHGQLLTDPTINVMPAAQGVLHLSDLRFQKFLLMAKPDIQSVKVPVTNAICNFANASSLWLKIEQSS